MHFEQWISVVSAVAYLAIGVTAVVGAKRSPMAPPLARLCAALFAYDTFEVLKHVSGVEEFFYFESAAASLIVPSAAALIIRFLGEWRRLRWLVVLGAVYFSLLSLLCMSATVVPVMRRFAGDAPWAIAMLAGMVPEFVLLAVLLRRHARRASAAERARTQLLVLAMGLGAGGASCDLASIAGLTAPRVTVFSLVAMALILAALALRWRLLDGVRALGYANAGTVVVLAVVLHVVVLSFFGQNTVLATTLAVAVTLAALATLRPIAAAFSEDRSRTQNLATMGRFSAQMAHDLKNPLAAIRGAAQFLAEEKARGGSLDEHAAFVALIVEQCDRLARVVGEYQRLGRGEAVRVPVDVAKLLEEVAAAQRTVSSKHVIDVAAGGAGESSLDRDLVAVALENLIRNAREASPTGGRIVLSARRSDRGLLLAVTDDGPGMDARLAERASDEFFTTKSEGSGLGLAFVSRVAEAHGGRARIDSREERGTTVELELADADPKPAAGGPRDGRAQK